MKWNTQLIGFLAGLIGPWIGGVIYYLLQFSHMTMQEFIDAMVKSGSFDEVISLSAIFNLALFFLFIRRNHNLAARGVILATFLYVLMVILIKVVE